MHETISWLMLTLNIIVAVSGYIFISQYNIQFWLNRFIRFKSVIKLIEISFIVGWLGLLSQAYREYLFLSTGVSPSDNEAMGWVFKDMGYWLIHLTIIYYVYLLRKESSK